VTFSGVLMVIKTYVWLRGLFGSIFTRVMSFFFAQQCV